MQRRNTQTIGDALKGFFEDNPALYRRILEIRVKRGWGEVLGPMIEQYTRSIYIKNGILYVSLTSSVLRNELVLSRQKLVKSLNDYARGAVIQDIIIR